ncbi:cysteine proteinase, partial [Saccharata proteae CBS 121410]
LENSPETLTALLQRLDSPSTPVTFHDILSITDPYLLDPSLPRPILALLLISPSKVYNAVRAADSAEQTGYTGKDGTARTASGDATGDTPILFFKQTIPGSCGIIALLHALCNSSALHHMTPASPLSDLIRAATLLPSEDRPQLLETSTELAAANEAVAGLGESRMIERGRRVENHYVCFVKGGDGRLWELDGRREGPVDRGPLGEGEGVVSGKGVESGVGRYLGAEGGERCCVVGMGVGRGEETEG